MNKKKVITLVAAASILLSGAAYVAYEATNPMFVIAATDKATKIEFKDVIKTNGTREKPTQEAIIPIKSNKGGIVRFKLTQIFDNTVNGKIFSFGPGATIENLDPIQNIKDFTITGKAGGTNSKVPPTVDYGFAKDVNTGEGITWTTTNLSLSYAVQGSNAVCKTTFNNQNPSYFKIHIKAQYFHIASIKINYSCDSASNHATLPTA